MGVNTWYSYGALLIVIHAWLLAGNTKAATWTFLLQDDTNMYNISKDGESIFVTWPCWTHKNKDISSTGESKVLKWDLEQIN